MLGIAGTKGGGPGWRTGGWFALGRSWSCVAAPCMAPVALSAGDFPAENGSIASRLVQTGAMLKRSVSGSLSGGFTERTWTEK